MTDEMLINTLLSLVGFFALYYLHGIQSAIKGLRDAINEQGDDFRGQLGGLDRRVTRVETRCAMKHNDDAG